MQIPASTWAEDLIHSKGVKLAAPASDVAVAVATAAVEEAVDKVGVEEVARCARIRLCSTERRISLLRGM